MTRQLISLYIFDSRLDETCGAMHIPIVRSFYVIRAWKAKKCVRLVFLSFCAYCVIQGVLEMAADSLDVKIRNL
jgi:hypothetical protein